MEEFRLHGSPPYSIVMVHGGPGAAGEMYSVADHLSGLCGVLEPFQTGMSIEEQVSELGNMIMENCRLPVILVGFSWGAWLVILTAVKYPDLISKLILIGCGPLEQKYAADVFETRLNRLDQKYRTEFIHLLEGIEQGSIKDTADAYGRLGILISKADTYKPLSMEEPAVLINPEVFRRVWAEASQLRKSGSLIKLTKRVRCPVVAIHGDYDPHPAEGVQIPLNNVLQDFRFHLLKGCGHKPWIEETASKEFFRILQGELISFK